MISLKGSNIAIIGGGNFCRVFLQIMACEDLIDQMPNILGVADKNKQAEGIEYARQKGIFTTDDYREFFHFKDLHVILELTRDTLLAEGLKKEIPPGIKLIDHFEAAFLWISLQIEEAKIKTHRELQKHVNHPEKTRELFDQFSCHLEDIIKKRTEYSLRIKRDLMENESTMSQIIQGTTIPTFVINRDHIVTYWNRALEKLTGYSADEIVGTNKHWLPFREKERPVMADFILYQFEEGEINKYYGENWSKSNLIEDAYEAEEFFPGLGGQDRWAFFTAAPIKRPDGAIIGAIETIWDTTEKKKAEEERERHTRELAALCSIYNSLSSPFELEDRINEAIEEVNSFLSAESICIFLRGEDNLFRLMYSRGISEGYKRKYGTIGENSVVHQVFQSDKWTLFEDLPEGSNENIGLSEIEGLKSLAYIPIKAKEKKAFGVIRIGTKRIDHFSTEEINVIELISNRIGITIENSVLYEQYIKSEEKYRSLFNNDPNPIFIIDRQTLNILDVNSRAEICYGYSRDEFFQMHFPNLGDSDDEELINGLKTLSKDQSILFSKKRHYKKGHTPFYVNVNVSYAGYRNNDVLIAATTDITESVERETHLVQASKMTTLGLMAAGMAHEINQPLNVIQVWSDYFQKMIKKNEPIKDEDLITLAKDISENVQRATDIIKHMRDFARQSEVVRTKVNINDPIRDVFKVLGDQLRVHQVELKLDFDPELPNIMAEHNRLEQVFINLVTNAIDAMDEKASQLVENGWKKQLEIRSFLENNQVVVTVSDTGIGMSREIINKIFEPFFTTKEIGKGTGLGVSISHGIIKDYDGDIQIESEFGKGTTFLLRFPALDH